MLTFEDMKQLPEKYSVRKSSSILQLTAESKNIIKNDIIFKI